MIEHLKAKNTVDTLQKTETMFHNKTENNYYKFRGRGLYVKSDIEHSDLTNYTLSMWTEILLSSDALFIENYPAEREILTIKTKTIEKFGTEGVECEIECFGMEQTIDGQAFRLFPFRMRSLRFTRLFNHVCVI